MLRCVAEEVLVTYFPYQTRTEHTLQTRNKMDPLLKPVETSSFAFIFTKLLKFK
jgi:hypothetical protein